MRERPYLLALATVMVVVLAATTAVAAPHSGKARASITERLSPGALTFDVKAPYERAVVTLNGPGSTAVRKSFQWGQPVTLRLASRDGSVLPDGRYRYSVRLSPRSKRGGYATGVFFIEAGRAVDRESKRTQLADIRKGLNRERAKANAGPKSKGPSASGDPSFLGYGSDAESPLYVYTDYYFSSAEIRLGYYYYYPYYRASRPGGTPTGNVSYFDQFGGISAGPFFMDINAPYSLGSFAEFIERRGDYGIADYVGNGNISQTARGTNYYFPISESGLNGRGRGNISLSANFDYYPYYPSGAVEGGGPPGYAGGNIYLTSRYGTGGFEKLRKAPQGDTEAAIYTTGGRIQLTSIYGSYFPYGGSEGPKPTLPPYYGYYTSLIVTPTGVGVGSFSPYDPPFIPVNKFEVHNGSLRVERDDGVTTNIRLVASQPAVPASGIYGPSQNWLTQVNANTGIFAIRDETAGKSPFKVFPDGAQNTLVVRNGNVGIGTRNPQATLDVNGPIFQRGSQLHADFIFEEDYELETIEEHAELMWENKHLPAMPQATTDENGLEVVEIGAHRRGIVEELEKAHIYIQQLEERLRRLEEQLARSDPAG